MLRLKVVVSASVLFCILGTLPLWAARRPDVPSSQNGQGPASACPDTHATPFFTPLDGSVGPAKGAFPDCDPKDQNKPNPPFSPATWPNLIVTLTGTAPAGTFTVTITPGLWEVGSASSKSTIFSVQFSGPSGLTLQSLLIGFRLDNLRYVMCDQTDVSNTPMPSEFCISSPLEYEPGSPPPPPLFPLAALESTPIALSDNSAVRMDFNQGDTGPWALAAAGFPLEFSKIDAFPNSNTLTAASFASSHFLAIVTDASNNPYYAGGLPIPKKASAAPNDFFGSAINIKKVPFTSTVDTSLTNPLEITSGADAGGMSDGGQGDPIPTDPSPANPGVPCRQSWPPGASVFRSVWYTYTPTITNNYQIKTASSRYDTGVYVFTGTPVNSQTPPASPTPVACNDDAPTSGVAIQSSYVNFAATAGTTYYIMVSEVPPPVGIDVTNTIPMAAPLSGNATLDFSLSVGSAIVFSGVELPPSWMLNFPFTALKSTSSIAITATNTTSFSADISSIAIISSGAQDFSQTSNCVGTLGPGAQCTITVTFAPKAAGQHNADLQLHVTGGANPAPIALSGNAS